MGMRRDDITGDKRMQIALTVLAPDRAYGEITCLSEIWHLSRQGIYKIADRVRDLLRQLLAPGRHGPAPKQTTINVDRNRMVRAVGTLTLAGVSQRDVIDCLEEILDTSVSLGWVNGRIGELEEAAASWNQRQQPDSGESLSGDSHSRRLAILPE